LKTEQTLEHWPLERFIDYARNPRKNDHAVDKVASAIREFGFRVPVVAKSDGTVVDGHLRLKAAKKLGLDTVPVLLADDLSETQIKAFRISVNKMAELADWDSELLQLELADLHEADFDMDLLGFDAADLSIAMGFEDGLDGEAPAPDNAMGYGGHHRAVQGFKITLQSATQSIATSASPTSATA
jgi:ParB-like chromosome segregation protein Spo0J